MITSFFETLVNNFTLVIILVSIVIIGSISLWYIKNWYKKWKAVKILENNQQMNAATDNIKEKPVSITRSDNFDNYIVKHSINEKSNQRVSKKRNNCIICHVFLNFYRRLKWFLAGLFLLGLFRFRRKRRRKSRRHCY